MAAFEGLGVDSIDEGGNSRTAFVRIGFAVLQVRQPNKLEIAILGDLHSPDTSTPTLARAVTAQPFAGVGTAAFGAGRIKHCRHPSLAGDTGDTGDSR
jgi:hypothetical protein